jgi:hypothetical protein
MLNFDRLPYVLWRPLMRVTFVLLVRNPSSDFLHRVWRAL